MNNQEYNKQEQQIIDMLTPKVELKPSADFKERILTAAKEQQAAPTTPHLRLGMWIKTTVSVAALVAIAFTVTINTPAGAARRHFAAAITAANEIKTMIINLNVRTEADEPMDYIDLEGEFVPTSVKVVYSEPMAWSIEKQGGRKLLYQGDNKIYQWIEGHSEGWYTTPTSLDSEWVMFIAPQELLGLEMRLAKERKGSKYEVSERGDVVEVKVTSTAEGDFSESRYMLNTSLAEANTVREYSFDKASGRLLKMRIDILSSGKKHTTVVESTSICYDSPLTAEGLVDNEFPYITFSSIDYTSDAPTPLAGITAEEAARIILGAMGDWNEDILSTALYYYKGSMAKLAGLYKGLKVVSVGKSFKSGLYPGRFVKCRVVLASGEEEELIVALRNDNSQSVWLLDGGL